MKITILDNEQAFFSRAAFRIASEMAANPKALMGLSTGRTTTGIHAALASLYSQYPFDTSGLTVFAVDEITNMPRECPASCYYLLLQQVVKPLGIRPENFIMPDPMAANAEAECRDFARRVRRRGETSLQVLGIGENGHLGFNQPGTPFGREAWMSVMDESLDERLRRENNIAPDVPMGGLTFGIRDIMSRSEKILLVANGAAKAQVVEQALFGPVTEALPASVLQLHPDCEVLLDKAAGALVEKRLQAR